MDHFAQLRELLLEEPSEEVWGRIRRLFSGWKKGIDVGLEYANDHMDDWPDYLRPLEDFYDHVPRHAPLVRVVRSGTVKKLGIQKLAESEGLKEITILDLSSYRVQKDISFLEGFERLKDLSLGRNGIFLGKWSIKDYSVLATLQHLEKLDVSKSLIGNNLDCIASLPYLTDLALFDAEVTDKELAKISSPLRSLQITRNEVSLEGVLQLPRTLEHLYASHTLLEAEEPKRIAEEFPNLVYLKTKSGYCIRREGPQIIDMEADLPF